jgi:hypothetical protein
MRRKGRTVVLPGVLAALVIAGCGSDDHPNDPRPAVPEEVSAKVGEDKVVVSPREFGAGLAVFTISNQTDDVVQLTLEGPTEAISEPIEAGGVTDAFKVSVAEGDYLVSAGDESNARSTELIVGPDRRSSSNELLLP